MSPPADARHRRLVLKLSTRHDAEVILDLAVTLAAALHSELSAFFLEEEGSITAGMLPFPTLVDFAGATVPTDRSRIETAFRREAEACRRLLDHAARQAELAWSFLSIRGELPTVLSEIGGTGDILALRLDPIALTVADAIEIARRLGPAFGGILLLPQRAHPHGGAVVMLGDAGPLGVIAETARELARALGTSMIRTDPGALGPDWPRLPPIATARLVVAAIEGPLLHDSALARTLAGGLRAPLLLLRGNTAAGDGPAGWTPERGQ